MYFVLAAVVSIELPGWQTLAAWTTNRLAFASQVFALGVFEISAALAIGVALLIRARDLLIGSFGLLIASRAMER